MGESYESSDVLRECSQSRDAELKTVGSTVENLPREGLGGPSSKSVFFFVMSVFPQVLRIRNRLSGKVLPIDDWHRQHALKVVRRKGESKPLRRERRSESWLSRMRRGRCALWIW